MRIRAIPIREPAIFERLVLEQIDSIEDKIEILERGIDTQWGPLTLALDSSRRLVMIVVSSVQQEDLISRLMSIHRWLSSSLPLINRFYGKKGLDFSKGIRALALSQSFSAAVLEGQNSFNFPVEFYRCRGIDVNGDQGVMIELYQDQPVVSSPSDIVRPEVGHPNLTEAEMRFFEQTQPSSPSA